MNYNSMWSTIPINFVPITQFLLENDKNQEWHTFYGLIVITRTNEPNQVSASSLLEDINFPLQGVVVVTCCDASPTPRDTSWEVALIDNCTGCSISSRSHYICFVPSPPNIHHSSLLRCCGKRKTQHVL